MMKEYKKNIFVLGMAILSGGDTIATKTKVDLSNRIMATHAGLFLFDPGSLFFEDAKKNFNDVRKAWKQTLDGLKKYVDENAVANKVLINSAQLVKQVGDQLVTIMHEYKKGKSKLGDYLKWNDVTELSLKQRELEKTKDKLKEESFWWKVQQKEDAKNVLLEMISLLQKTINSAVKNFRARADILKPIEEKKEQPPKKVFDRVENLVPTDMMSNLRLCLVHPCHINLGTKNGLNRQLLQIGMAKQIEARCGGLSLINILWAKRYAKSGNVNDLTYLHNANNAKKVLDTIGCGNLVDIGKVEAYFKDAQNKGYDVSNIDAISSILVVNKDLAEFLFGEETATGQELKNKVRKGLKQDFFFHGIIIGNEETQVGGSGHYFAFVIIKVRNQVQYIVIDSLEDVNHLTPGSYNRRRIDYLIDQFETGKAVGLIPFTRFKKLADNTRDEIKRSLSKIEEDRKLLSQEEFIQKNIGNLINLQEQIKEYQILIENPAALQKEKKEIGDMMDF